MKRVRKLARGMTATLLCLGLLCGGALADVTTPVSEEPEGEADFSWEEPAPKLTVPFPDVPKTADYTQAVAALVEMGIITGDNKGNFNPNDTINRAEVATIICRVMGVEEEAKAMKNAVFTDVPSTHWAVGYVAKAAELGIINGYGNGTFGPGNPVTYEQMVKMLVCAWGYEEEAKEAGGWPRGYIEIATDMGIIDSENLVSDTTVSAARWRVALLTNNAVMLPTNYEGGNINENR